MPVVMRGVLSVGAMPIRQEGPMVFQQRREPRRAKTARRTASQFRKGREKRGESER
jgi:hypothetical protein